MSVCVRPAEEDDAAAVALSHVRGWQAGYAGLIPDEFLSGLGRELTKRTTRWQAQIVGAEAAGQFVLVAEHDGEVAGWVQGGPYRDDAAAGVDGPPLAEVYGLYVDPSHWRDGVGGALMRSALERLAAAGFREAFLWVLEENPRARAFYEANGWVLDSARKPFEVAGERLVEVRYSRSLP